MYSPRDSSQDIIQYQYYRGILTYLEVAHFESKNKQLQEEVARRLESAYGYLQPFNDLLACKIRCTIAFKFNWFFSLAYAPKNSIFYLAYIFFTRSYNDIKLIQISIEDITRSQEGIYLIEQMELLLELIALFFDEKINHDRFNELYKNVIDHNDNSFNFRIKFDLIIARLHRKLKNFSAAAQIYKKLRYNEDFTQEVEEFLQYVSTISNFK